MADLLKQLQELSQRASRVMGSIATEEACKTAFVMPLLRALGYDVFNPEEVIPEFIADVGTKKGEKVDYAIRKDGKIIMLIECKWSGRALTLENASQLFRYFTVTSARCAVLTNGLMYQFYTDIDEANKMDRVPFFVFNLLDFTEASAGELVRFSRDLFDVNAVLGAAATLKQTNAIKQRLADELHSPSEPFVRALAAKLVDGRMTQSVLDQYVALVQRAFAEFIRDQLSERLKSALRAEAPQVLAATLPIESSPETSIDTDQPDITTTDEERDAFQIIRAICRQWVSPQRIVMRDAKSYCAVLLDDNNRKPIARLHFNALTKRYLGVFSMKQEERIEISSLDDIFTHAARLKSAIDEYEKAI
jgi:hypothetical protein